MLKFIELASAIRVLFSSGIEFKPECFVPLAGAKLEAYVRKIGPLTEPVYEVVAMEPTVIERSPEKVTLELSIVSDRERKHMLDAVKFVYNASASMPGNQETISFADRLEWLRPRLPEVITGHGLLLL